jgi:peptidoglycan/LPS O-acetylase OafA/YrhL
VKEFWTYTLLRIVLFLATAAVAWGIYALMADTINLLVVVLVAAVVSSVLSWKLLAGPRNRFAASVEARASRASARFEEIKAREDTD